ncbi:MAG: GGDEF domain-containing protein [Myxococcaceae bacterium]|nr:GGDEF domain-containing protein [Myxococcaceae bacterium]
MKRFKWAAVFEPKEQHRKAIAAGLKKAGLKVSDAQSAEALDGEQLVVLGPSAKSASKLARDVRKMSPRVVLFAAQQKGFKAPYADGILPMPVSPNDLRVRLAELTEVKPKVTRASSPKPRPGEGITDPLTNFYTFTHFKEVLFIEVKRARRYGFPLALALLGFDPLEAELDGELHSQLTGGLALAIRRSLRDTDFPVQYGSDRVLLLMPHTDLAGSLIVARRVCERVSRSTLQVGEKLLAPTLSAGVASGMPGREYGFSDLFRQANDGLHAAMAKGGNRVEYVNDVSSAPMPPTIPPLSSHEVGNE